MQGGAPLLLCLRPQATPSPAEWVTRSRTGGPLGQRSPWVPLICDPRHGLQGPRAAGCSGGRRWLGFGDRGALGRALSGACGQTRPPPSPPARLYLSALHLARAPGACGLRTAEFALKKGKLRLRKGMGPTQGHTKETTQSPRPVLAASSWVPPSAVSPPRCGVGGGCGTDVPQGPQRGDPLSRAPTRSHRGCWGVAP